MKKGKTLLALFLALAMVTSVLNESQLFVLAEGVPAEEAVISEEELQPEEEPLEKEAEDTESEEKPLEEEVGDTEPETEPQEKEVGDTEEEAEEPEAKEEPQGEEVEQLQEQTIEAEVCTEEAVSITLTGLLPEGAYAKAVPVDLSLDGVTVISAYDITIYDGEEAVFQPLESSPICVKVEDDGVREALEAEEELEIFHLEDEHAAPEPVETVTTSEGSVEFQADHFSIYAVTIPETHYTHTYQFMDEDGTTELSKQILSAGETLLEPESPSKDHKRFLGWEKEDGTLFTSFDTAEGALTASSTTILKAKFEAVYYVFYKADANADSKVLWTQTYTDENAKILTGSVPFSAPSGRTLLGWATTADASEPDISSGKTSVAGKDWTLYPVTAEACWITFDSRGGTILEPAYVLSGQATIKPQDPKKAGYTFDGWYQDEACTKSFTFGATLTTDQLLYAKWKPVQTSYTVIHWWENADDSGYSYHESETKYGLTGEQTAAAGKSYSVAGKDLFGAKVSRQNVFTAQTIKQETIKGDGSTIVHVYYQRASYQLVFRHGSSSGTVLKRLEKKYGAKITSAEWPQFQYDRRGSSIVENGCKAWLIGASTYLAYSSTMPLGGGTLWTYDYDTTTGKAGYYLEDLKGSYVLDHQDPAAASGNTIGKEDAYEITGFTFRDLSAYTTDRRSEWRTGITYNNIRSSAYYFEQAKFYYSRNSYQIVYHNGNETAKEVSYKYEADISNAGNYVPVSRPLGVDSDYQFDGWYQDPEGTDRYVFQGKTMPANHIVVYAKWKAPTYQVSFDLNGADSSDIYKAQTVAKGNAAVQPKDPTRDGYVFAGWTKKGAPFSFETQITEDTVLKAQWISIAQYPLTYDSNNGTDAVQKDPKQYAVGAEAKVAELPIGWTAPEGKHYFTGWNTKADGTGTAYVPGDAFQMPEGLSEETGAVLYAQWSSKRETALTYDLNYDKAPAYGSVTIEIPNSVYAIGSKTGDPAATDPVRSGYRFLGWSTVKTPGTGETLLKKGDRVQVDTLQPENNRLYAQWQKQKVISVAIQKLVKGGFGDCTEVFDFSYTLKKNGESETPVTFQLKNEETYVISGVEEGWTIEIQETSEEGYTTSYQIGTNQKTETNVCSYTVGESDVDGSTVKVIFYNEKESLVPTGIRENGSAALCMLLAGAGMAVMMVLTRRRRTV